MLMSLLHGRTSGNQSMTHLTNFELLKALYIAISISPVALLSDRPVTSDNKTRVSLLHLGEVRSR